MEKQTYQPPIVEVLVVQIEQGFAQSGGEFSINPWKPAEL